MQTEELGRVTEGLLSQGRAFKLYPWSRKQSLEEFEAGVSSESYGGCQEQGFTQGSSDDTVN